MMIYGSRALGQQQELLGYNICLSLNKYFTKHIKLLYDMGRYVEAMVALNNVSKNANI